MKDTGKASRRVKAKPARLTESEMAKVKGGVNMGNFTGSSRRRRPRTGC